MVAARLTQCVAQGRHAMACTHPQLRLPLLEFARKPSPRVAALVVAWATTIALAGLAMLRCVGEANARCLAVVAVH